MWLLEPLPSVGRGSEVSVSLASGEAASGHRFEE